MPEIRLPVIQSNDPGQPPLFEKIAIVGLGLIGGSIALAAREIWPRGLVIAVDRKEVLEQAMVKHAIDVAADDICVIAEADVVILAAPVRQNIELLAQLDEVIDKPALITDTGSTKRAIVLAARTLPPRFTFVGGHPMGGAARGGFAAARPDLFKGRPWIFTPHSDGSGDAVERLYAFAAALGAQPQSMPAAQHDALLALISHLPQLAASALMAVVGARAVDGLHLGGRGLVDTTRLAASPAGIWQDIAATNADEIRRGLDALIDQLTALRIGLDEPEVIADVFARAARFRAKLMEGREL